MAYTTINKSSDHFNAKLYTGTGSSNAITGVGFQPDWVWIKERNGGGGHNIFDAVRGTGKVIYANATNAEVTDAQTLSAFGTDGFTVGTNTNVNENGLNHVAWNWKANGAGSVDSSSGSISATVSANTTAGFSIIKFTNPASGNFTIPHGLGVVPEMLFFKCTGGVQSWFVLHKDLSSFTDRYLRLQTDVAEVTYSMQTQAPTSTLLYLNSGGVSNANTETICYAFASKTGYSKFGKYIANASTDGTFIYTGFKPKFLMVKRINQAAPWSMIDASRNIYNPANLELTANTAGTEANQGDGCDFLSNGVKLRDSADMNSGNADSFMYMAFAAAPLVGTNNIPATAR